MKINGIVVFAIAVLIVIANVIVPGMLTFATLFPVLEFIEGHGGM